MPQKRLRTVRLPVGQQNLCLRREGVQNFGAVDAVLAVAGLKILVIAEGARLDALRQSLAKERFNAAKTAVEDRDLDALPAVAASMPAFDAKFGKP